MGANIITGYTGTRHITPAMDAAVYRSTFGPDSYILSDGNQLAGSMPSVNEFTVLDGLVSMQGHQIQVTQETLSVDTCANGYKRIDLVCMRFAHDNNTQIDSASLIVIKGTEVADPNDPVVPDYNEGDIDSGASVVDFPLYQINLAGSSVTFQKLAELHIVEDFIAEEGTDGIWTYRKWNSGIAECWGTTAYRSVTTTSAFGAVYYGPTQTVTYPSGLFTVAPKATITILSGNGLWAGITSETTTAVTYYPYAPKNQSHTIAEQVMVIGRWK